MTEEASKNRLLAHNHLHRPQNKRDEDLVEQRSRICILLWINLSRINLTLLRRKRQKWGPFTVTSWKNLDKLKRKPREERAAGNWVIEKARNITSAIFLKFSSRPGQKSSSLKDLLLSTQVATFLRFKYYLTSNRRSSGL